jgi:hypothetical protein
VSPQATDRAMLVEQLSARMLRNKPESCWRRLLMDFEEGKVSVHADHRTFLCARLDAASDIASGSIDSEVAFVAAGCGAEIDPWPTGDALLSFRDPTDALTAAMELSQLMGRIKLQIGLSRGRCNIAVIDTGETQLHVALGHAVDIAGDACDMAPAGTVRMSAAVYEALQSSVANLRDCLVATEYQGLGIGAVSLTLAPSPMDALSTFAGIGLT